MQRNLNRALLAQLMASGKPALESEEVPAVVPAEAASTTTPEAVAAASGEAGVPETPPAAETTAPTVIIKVEVEQASKPADAAPPADVVPPAEPVAEIVPDATGTEVPPADGEAAAEVAADAATDVVPAEGAAEVPPAEGAEVPPAEGEAAPAADAAPAEGAETPAADAAGEAGEVAPEAPAGGEAPAAEVPEGGEAPSTETPAEGEAPAADAAPAADSGEPAAEPAVDAKPTQGEEDAAAAEVQAAIDETKAGDEEGAVAEVSAEDLVVTSDITPIGAEPDVIHPDQIAPELEEMQSEINGYVSGGDALDKIADIAESAAEEGGLPKSAAQVLEVAVEHIHQSLGLPAPIAILSMESFDQPGIRVRATAIAMEEIAKTAADIWKTIKEAIAKFFTMVVGFYDKVVSGAAMQQKTAEGILKQLESLGDKKAEGTVGSATLVKALARGTSASKNVPQDLLTTDKVMSLAYQHGAILADSITSLLSNEANVAAAKEKLVQLVGSNVAAVLKPDANLSDVGVADAPEGTQGFATLPLLGNHVLWAYVPKSVDGLGKMAFGRQVVQAEVQGDALPVLNTSDIKAIASIVVNSTKGMALIAGQSRKLKAALNSFNTYAQQAAQADAKPDPVMTKVLHQLAAGLSSNAAKIALANNSAALQYCKLSLTKLNPKAEAAPAEGAAPAAAPAAA